MIQFSAQKKQSSDFDKWSTLGQKKSRCWFSYGIDFYFQKRVQNKQNDQRVGDIHALGFSFCTRPDSHWGLAEGYSKSPLIISLSSSTSSIIRFLSSLSLYLVGLYTVFFSFWARSARSESEEKATVKKVKVYLCSEYPDRLNGISSSVAYYLTVENYSNRSSFVVILVIFVDDIS